MQGNAKVLTKHLGMNRAYLQTLGKKWIQGFLRKTKKQRPFSPCFFCLKALLSIQESNYALSSILMPDVPVVHNSGPLLVVRTILQKVRKGLCLRHGNMKKIHIYPANHVKPDFDKLKVCKEQELFSSRSFDNQLPNSQQCKLTQYESLFLGICLSFHKCQ